MFVDILTQLCQKYMLQLIATLTYLHLFGLVHVLEFHYTCPPFYNMEVPRPSCYLNVHFVRRVIKHRQ